jgi:hypothetical protein
MKRSTLFAPVFIITLAVLTIVVCALVYGARTGAVRRGIAGANERFDKQQTEKGFAQLTRIDSWAGQHPAFMSQVRCAAIRGHVQAGDDNAAIELAEREQANDRTPPRPSNVWQALYQVTAEQLDPIWLKDIGGRQPDPNAGYQALLRALQATGNPQRLARAEQQTAISIREVGRAKAISETVTAPAITTPPSAPVAVPDVEPAHDVPDSIPDRHDFGTGRFAVAAGASIRVYSKEGKHCGDLRAGTLLTVLKTSQGKKSDGGEIAVCRQEDAGTSDPPLLVRTRDLIIRDGSLAQIPPNVSDLLAAHGRASSQLKRARQDAAQRNPHAAAYKAATAAYKTFAADVKRLTAARDQAEGADRTRYSDELHLMKNQAPELQSAYETSKREYEAWKATNQGAADSDPQVTAFQRRVDKAAQALAPYFDS